MRIFQLWQSNLLNLTDENYKCKYSFLILFRVAGIVLFYLGRLTFIPPLERNLKYKNSKFGGSRSFLQYIFDKFNAKSMEILMKYWLFFLFNGAYWQNYNLKFEYFLWYIHARKGFESAMKSFKAKIFCQIFIWSS